MHASPKIGALTAGLLGEERKKKKKEETTGQKYNVRICYTQGGHK